MESPADVAATMAAIRASVEKVPNRIDGWVGKDIPPSIQATTLLKPNVIISRQYINVDTGMPIGFLLVHCSDAHDMAGHFPLRCYPAQDWKVISSEAKDWVASDMSVPGMEYKFTKDATIGGKGEASITVANFLLRPGHIVRDMDAMVSLIRGAGGQAQGAAQVQVCFYGEVPPEFRDRTVKSFITAYEPVIRAILADPTKVVTSN